MYAYVYVYVCVYIYIYIIRNALQRCSTVLLHLDFLRGSSANIGTVQRRLAWPLRKDDTHTSRSDNKVLCCVTVDLMLLMLARCTERRQVAARGTMR